MKLSGYSRSWREPRSVRSSPMPARPSPTWRQPRSGSTASSNLRRSRKSEQMKEMEWFIKAAEPFKGMEIKVVSETIPTHEYELQVADQGVRGDHRDQGHPRPDPGRRRDREAADAVPVGREHLRRLHQRQRPDRHPQSLWLRRATVGLHGGRGQGRYPADARRRRLHRQVVHDRARTASSTSCPTSSSPTSTGSATTGSATRH